MAARGGTGLPLKADGKTAADLAGIAQWNGFEEEYSNVEGVRIAPMFKGSIRTAIQEARDRQETGVAPIGGMSWDQFNKDFPMKNPFEPGTEMTGLRRRGGKPVEEPTAAPENTPPRPNDIVRDPSRLPSRTDPKQLDFSPDAPEGDFFNPGDNLGNLAAEAGEGLEMEEVALLTGSSAVVAGGGLVAYAEGVVAATGTGLSLGGAAVVGGAIGVVIAGGIGLYFLFDALFKNDEYNERWTEGIERLINTWKNEAVYVWCKVAGDKNGPKWWKAVVTKVNINDDGIESWDLEGQINAGIKFNCNIEDAFSIMKQRDGPPVNARQRMYGYDFETAKRIEPRHYDVWDNIMNPFPSSVDYVWKVKFERSDVVKPTSENTLEFLHPTLRIVVDFDKRTFLVYVPSNTKRSLVVFENDALQARDARGEVGYMHPPVNADQDLEQAFGIYNLVRAHTGLDPYHAPDLDHEQTEVNRIWDAILPFTGNTFPNRPAATLFHHVPGRPFRDEGPVSTPPTRLNGGAHEPVLEPPEPEFVDQVPSPPGITGIAESTETVSDPSSDLETTASMAAMLIGPEPTAAQIDNIALRAAELVPDMSALSPGAPPPAFGAPPDLLGLPDVPDNVDLGPLGNWIPEAVGAGAYRPWIMVAVVALVVIVGGLGYTYGMDPSDEDWQEKTETYAKVAVEALWDSRPYKALRPYLATLTASIILVFSLGFTPQATVYSHLIRRRIRCELQTFLTSGELGVRRIRCERCIFFAASRRIRYGSGLSLIFRRFAAKFNRKMSKFRRFAAN